MIMPLGFTLSVVLIDVSLAIIALVVGFYSAIWYTNHANPHDKNADNDQDKAEKSNDAERTNMAALQLRDLAQTMAADVGDHCVLVENITDKLGALPSDGTQDNRTAVASAVAQIVSANEKLQTRLEDAEAKIQSQAEEIRTQQFEARTDVLTQLANRRAFDDAIAREIKDFRTSKYPCSLLIFDVDHFKKFNDMHGHQAGDEVLRSLGQEMTQAVKATDLPCRYGGEEFAVVLRNTSTTDGRIAAERIRKAIEEMTVQFEGKELRITASIGLAELAVDENSTNIIRRADEALYASKEAGRNCGHWHDGSHCLPLDVEGEKASDNEASENEAKSEATNVPSDSESTLAVESPEIVSFDSLPDQSVFADELRRRISESHRFGVALSVMHLQVKDYPKLASEYGDAVGHLLLDSVTQSTMASLRDMDLLGKFESGSFIVMLPGSSGSEANLVAMRVQSAIANCVIPLGGKKLSLELHLGLTTVQPDDDVKRMMARAKQEMEETIKAEAVAAGG